MAHGGAATVVRMIEVILPALDDQEALPWVLDQMPGRLPADRRRQRLGPTARPRRPDARRGLVVTSRSGLRGRLLRRARRGDADVVCFMDCDGSLDGADLPSVAAPVAAGDADLVLGARVAGRGAWPLHARLANRDLARGPTAHRPRAARPRADAGRAASGAARPGAPGPAIRVAARDGGRAADTGLARSPRSTSRTVRIGRVEGHRDGAGHRSARCATWRWSSDRAAPRHGAGARQGAGPGTGEDPAVARRCTPDPGRGDRPGRRRRHPDRGHGERRDWRTTPRARRCGGRVARPAGSRVVAQCGRRPRRTARGHVRPTPTARRCSSGWTHHRSHTTRIDACARRGSPVPDVDAVLGLTTDGGWSIIGFARSVPDAFRRRAR